MAEQIAIVGLGRMGLGVVELAARQGFRVIAVKATGGDVTSSVKKIAEVMARRVEKGKLSSADRDAALARIEATSELEAIAGADFVIESAVEELAPKQDLLAKLETLSADDAVLATN